MGKKETVKYWIKSAKEDWEVAQHLYDKKDYAYALFFCHLTIEKIPPYTHSLVYLAEKTKLNLTEKQLELLEIITDFNIEARYPDEKFLFKKKCTKEFTQKYKNETNELKKWLLQQIKL
jgi:HEPN domain-containing protein